MEGAKTYTSWDSPFEEGHDHGRGEVVASRLHKARHAKVKVAQIALEVPRVWEDMRVCVPNGFFLCNKPAPPRNIESIVVYHWDELQERWIGEFLYVQTLEDKKIRSVTGKRTYSVESIAAILVMHEKDSVVREQRLRKVMAG